MTTVDSAGVHITVIRPSSTPQRGRLGDPVISIGAAGGNEAYLFNRVSGGLLLGDGIVVADAGDLTVRFFDSMGGHLKTIGGLGEGPGEFRDLGWMGRYRGDSIVVWDRALQRVTLVDGSGGIGRATRLPSNPAGAPIRHLASTRDGTLFGRGTIPGSGSASPWEMWRDTLALIRYQPDGSQPQLIAKLPGDDRYTLSTSGGSRQINNHPLGRIPALIASGDSLFFAEGTTTSVDVLSADGTLGSRVRLATEPREVSEDHIARLKSSFLGEDPEPGWSQEVERIFSSLRWPERIPGSGALFLDPSGNIWLEVFEPVDGVGREWVRFGPNGGYSYTLETPPGFVPLDFGTDFVLGLEQDDLGVERITLRPIQASRPGSI